MISHHITDTGAKYNDDSREKTGKLRYFGNHALLSRGRNDSVEPEKGDIQNQLCIMVERRNRKVGMFYDNIFVRQ